VELRRPKAMPRFAWSGRNSIYARQSASLALRAHLQKLLDRYPDAKHFVIAHSHAHDAGDSLMQLVILQSVQPILPPWLWAMTKCLASGNDPTVSAGEPAAQ